MKKRTKFLLGLILGFALVTRLWNLNYPQNYYFDEVYHAFTAGAYAQNDPKGYEWWHTSVVEGTAYEWLHPPVSKLMMAVSIWLIGDESFAWRFPGALMGVIMVGVCFWLGKVIFGSRRAGLWAGAIASLEGLLLAQSRIAMNDIYVTTWMLLGIGWYWKWRKEGRNNWKDLMISAGWLGLGVATKWSGVFALGTVGLWEIMELIANKGKHWRKSVAGGLIYLVAAGGIYIASYSQFWLQGHTWQQWVELHKQIWWYQTNLEATHAYQSTPIQWLLNLKPVWYFVEYKEKTVANIYALANPAIAWGGLLAAGWMLWQGVRAKKREYLFWLSCYLWVWLPWVGSPRIMFFYHYTPAMAWLSIGIGESLARLEKTSWGKWFGFTYLLVVIGMFVFFWPVWTGVAVPTEWSKWFFWISSWK